MAESEEELKSLLKVKKDSEKVGLKLDIQKKKNKKLDIQKTKIVASSPSLNGK